MKKIIFSIMIMFAFVACETDATAIWDKLKDHEARIAKLETLCDQLNTNISSLQAILSALENNDYVTGVTPIVEGGKEIGYTITFTKSKPITIYHGKDGEKGQDGENGKDGEDGQDGKDGEDGQTPIIGVKMDEDGIYYWTLNGEWLLDDQGNKIKAVGLDGANGENGITPKLKIENDYWYVSYDDGATWIELFKAVGEQGEKGDKETKVIRERKVIKVTRVIREKKEIKVTRARKVTKVTLSSGLSE
jgi:hypothetical protein